MIVSDTREKANDHVLKYFDRHGIEYRVAKVDTGDYMLDERPDLRVERKKSLSELCMNLCSPDRRRFYDEIHRAHDQGIRLVILCEQYGVKSLTDVASWRNPYGRVTGRQLQDAIYRLEVGYSVPVLFCDKRSTGRRIIEILTEENNDGEQRL